MKDETKLSAIASLAMPIFVEATNELHDAIIPHFEEMHELISIIIDKRKVRKYLPTSVIKTLTAEIEECLKKINTHFLESEK